MQSIFIFEWFLWIFSSPKLKADTNFSDHLMSFVYSPSVFLWTFYIFIFFSTTTWSISTKPGKTHSWMKGNQVFLNKSPCTFSMIDDSEIVNYFPNLQKSFSNPQGQFQSNLAQSFIKGREFKFVQVKNPNLFQGKIIVTVRMHWQLHTHFLRRR